MRIDSTISEVQVANPKTKCTYRSSKLCTTDNVGLSYSKFNTAFVHSDPVVASSRHDACPLPGLMSVLVGRHRPTRMVTSLDNIRGPTGTNDLSSMQISP
jgi:hypothetical protein